MRGRRVAIGLAGVLGAILLSAGACEDRGTVDAPIDVELQDNQAPLIVNMPNGYMNLAVKCLGRDLLVAHTRDAAPTVVANADACAEGNAERYGIPRVAEVD
ncbi:MAG: hypothetical protein S0880_20725 [Actinomycetota bacterium]|nr:hypothetical protein [Actinomycetota bacterium]